MDQDRFDFYMLAMISFATCLGLLVLSERIIRLVAA